MSHARKIQKKQTDDPEELREAPEVHANVFLVSNPKTELLTYGILAINQAHNEGILTYKEWLTLSQEWAIGVLKDKHQRGDTCKS